MEVWFYQNGTQANAPIVPIHLDAKNPWKFYVLSFIYKSFETLLLSHEILTSKHKAIKATIGELIAVESFTQTNIFLDFQRQKKPIFPTQKCITHPQKRHLLKAKLQDT